MAAAMNMRPSWPSKSPEGYFADYELALCDQPFPDQGPAQARGNALLGGTWPGVITIGLASRT